jgi:RNA polymerase sigma-70 factor (ECF subfamily)
MDQGNDVRASRLFLRFREEGDAEALAEVVEQALPWLVRRGGRWFRSVADREDALQETLLRAMELAPRWDSSRPVLPWLLGILRHVAAEQRRRRWLIAPLAADVAAPTACSPQPQEAARAVESALRGLPPAYREIVHLRLVQRERVVDIAKTLDLPIATARSRLQRGMRMLRSSLPHGLSLVAFAAAVRAGQAPSGQPSRHSAMAATAAGMAAAAAATLFLWLHAPAPAASAAAAVASIKAPAVAAAAVAAVRGGAEVIAERAEVAAPTVRVFGRIATAVPVDWRAAEVVARPVASGRIAVPAAVAMFDERSAAELRALRSSVDAVVARAPVGSDGAFAIETPPQPVVLDVVDRTIGLIEPKLVHIDAGVERVDVGVLSGYVGRSVRGIAPLALAGAELAAWVEVSPWQLRQHTDALAVTARPWRGRIGSDGAFAVDALPAHGALLLVAEDAEGRRWWSEPGPSERAPAWRRAVDTLVVETSPPAATGEVVATHVTGFRVAAPLTAGRCRLPALPSGPYDVVCRTDPGSVLHGRVDVAGAALCRLATAGLRQLAGTVVHADGSPVAGAAVEIRDCDGRSTTGAAATDANGRFVVAVTAAAKAVVRWQEQTHQFALADARGPLRLALAPRRSLRGRLLGRERAGAEALVTTFWTASGWLESPERATVVAADGSFVLHDVPTGPLSVGFHTPDGLFYRADIGVAADLGALAPKPPRTVRVRVRDESGRPAAVPLVIEASPTFLLAGGSSALASGVVPANDGAVVVPVPCWIERLHFHVADRSATAGITMRALLDAGQEGAEVRLQPAGRIASAASAVAPGDRWMIVADEDASDAPQVLWAPAAGGFRVDGLRPGDYRLEEWRRGCDRPLCRHRVRLAAGATATVDAPVARRVGVAIEGLPGEATVALTTGDGAHVPLANHAVNEVALTAGEHHVCCRSSDGSQIGLRRRLPLAPSAADLGVSFRLPSGRVCGRAPAMFHTAAIQVLPHSAEWHPQTLLPDADGGFGIGHVDPAACTLYCIAADGGAAAIGHAATGAWRCVATATLQWPIGAVDKELLVRSLDGVPLPLRCDGPVAIVPSGVLVADWGGLRVRIDARPGAVVTLE